jgi:hypothetical protein
MAADRQCIALADSHCDGHGAASFVSGAKVTMRRSDGFRTIRILELALYHSLGKLPQPELTHEFF